MVVYSVNAVVGRQCSVGVGVFVVLVFAVVFFLLEGIVVEGVAKRSAGALQNRQTTPGVGVVL